MQLQSLVAAIPCPFARVGALDLVAIRQHEDVARFPCQPAAQRLAGFIVRQRSPGVPLLVSSRYLGMRVGRKGGRRRIEDVARFSQEERRCGWVTKSST